MKVFVCAGSSEIKDMDYTNQAKLLGEILADQNVTYIQGGSANGMMGATLKEFCKYSKKVEIIIPEVYLKFDESALKQIAGEDLKITPVATELDRLKLIKTCDKIIVLPGGTGTIEEFMFCNETKRNHEHSADIILVNYKNFYDNLLNQLHNPLTFTPSSINFSVVEKVEDIF